MQMPSVGRACNIFSAFFIANFLAANVLLAGKVLLDFNNLRFYSHWEYFGGPIVGYFLCALFGTIEICIISFVPTLIGLLVTESLRIRSGWFYALGGMLTALLFDIACTKYSIVSARSYCRLFSWSELGVATVAGAVAGITFWWFAGHKAGAWRHEQSLKTSASV